MIDKLVERVFNTRNAVHIHHWKTKSYAQHEALGSLYDSLISELDGFVESYQGSFGLIDIKVFGEFKIPSDIVKHLESDVVWIAQNRSKIAKDVFALENLIDAITDVYLKSLYKLKNLS